MVGTSHNNYVQRIHNTMYMYIAHVHVHVHVYTLSAF